MQWRNRTIEFAERYWHKTVMLHDAACESNGPHVIPWVKLDVTAVPGGGELRLMRRGNEFSIMAGSTELMNSRLSGSEEALARLSCQAIAGRQAPAILIGGLGMGFTLRATLASLGKDARVTVAELVPAVVAWARGPMAEIFGTCLDDLRVKVQEADVGHIIRSVKSGYDAILLDVDNGPGGLTREANDSLYDMAGLSAARAALHTDGVLAVWSSAPDRDFTARLKRTGFAVDEIKVRANGRGGGARHVIWIARKEPVAPSRPLLRPRRRS